MKNKLQIYSIDGVVPVIHPSSFIDNSAVIIGDVVIGPNCYIGPNVSLRGDMASIEIGEGSNIQDNCTLHCMTGIPTMVGEWGHIGHGAVVHSARLGKNVLVGMNAVVMDESVIGENSVVAAMAFVKTGMHVAANSLVAGVPAKVIRQLKTQEIEWKKDGTRCYHELVGRCKSSLVPVEPLTEKDANRPSLQVSMIDGKN
ncbi:MAG: phenylacetic acid degradation protein PaaY [Cycloclasticus sp. symbiont of Poecilosclerida sp. M]|nr:MAG: phenylacetic acid degradation protein PaaY [Cycloclasticus sp. symbiont of Poecilosclerida sp. M]